MDYELEFAEGLRAIVRAEIDEKLPETVTISGSHRADALQLRYVGDTIDLEGLRTVNALYKRLIFDVPRPKALLGHQHFHRLLDAINAIRQRYPVDAFQSLHISAAGSDSSVMTRLKDELANATSLIADDDDGDLLLRIRRSPGKHKRRGWDVLVRSTPRPLATRTWRVCNMRGALDAAVAHAILRLANIQAGDVVVNLACGSATLLIECSNLTQSATLIGLDIDPVALACARENITAASINERVQLMQADGAVMPLLSGSADCLLADLPFGQLVGSHDDNLTLYPALLRDAARIARIGARFIIITHEVRLMQSVLAQTTDWTLRDEIKITLSGLHPRIFLLERV